jgi:hypothetical protein
MVSEAVNVYVAEKEKEKEEKERLETLRWALLSSGKITEA